MDHRYWLLSAIVPISSLAGLAALLRSDEPITWRAGLSATLNSGLFSLCIGSLMLHKFGEDGWMLILGVSVLSGLGGNAALYFGIELLKSYVGARIK